MSDPWSPKGAPRRSNEVRDPLDDLRHRLRSLGATAEEVDDWTGTEAWADLDDEQRESVEDLRGAGDDEIRFQIEAVRGGEDPEEDLEQGGEGTTAIGVDPAGISPEVDAIAHDRVDGEATGEPQDAAMGSITREDVPPAAEIPAEDAAEEDAEPVSLPAGLLDENVPEILAWVDGDRTKAEVVIEMESLTDKPRKTLVEPLREILDDAAG